MATAVLSSMDVDARPQTGLRAYYDAKIEELEVRLRDKTQNLRRLEAQRNELNGRGARSAREKGVVVVDRASAVRERTRKRDERNDRGEIANAARTTSED
jgi:hypothetical protein|tara:strand:+ start:1165 stop:1464 length:300 start_codon:yes stop_codon:yes gene_type:complete